MTSEGIGGRTEGTLLEVLRDEKFFSVESLAVFNNFSVEMDWRSLSSWRSHTNEMRWKGFHREYYHVQLIWNLRQECHNLNEGVLHQTSPVP